jgi:class 3 adenylate cyclase/ABC-type nitrate/sulfonate/bicarbonate transport system substrate-binding protein
MPNSGSALRGLRCLWLSTLVSLLWAPPSWGQDKVSLQLKWLHQFQFAGYYQALEQGFYRDAGLQVDIREGGPNVVVATELANGKADFGVCTTNVLMDDHSGARLTVLGVIFQHSPAIILIPSRARISKLSELASHPLMDAPGSDDIAAMLKHEGVDYASLPRIQHDGDPRELVAGKADAMVAYSTNEPFVLDQLHIPYQTFSPRAYGFDFYGDNLCTTAQQVAMNPERTRGFLDASLKGWAYALAHKVETVDLILKRYSREKSREALLFEANRTEALIQPDLIALGSQGAERWQHIADILWNVGMLASAQLPEELIYLGSGDGFVSRLRSVLPELGLFALGAFCLVLLYRMSRNLLKATLSRPKLSLVIAGLFVCLSIPVLIFILFYNYQRNAAAMVEILRADVDKGRTASIESMDNIIQRVADVLRLLADMAAARPEFFRTEQSRDMLYRVLTSSPEIDAAYVSFEDGYHRVVTRIDDDRRRADPRIPGAANWHSSFIDAFSAGDRRARHRLFFDTWQHVIGGYETPTTLDIRALPGYAAAKESRSLVVTDPEINPDTGYPILFVRAPIIRDGEFLGCASANITLAILSQFLATHRASPHSTMIVADASDGTIIAAADKNLSIRFSAEQADGTSARTGTLELARLYNVGDVDVREAYRLKTQTGKPDFVFRSPRSGDEISASFTRFPDSLGHAWESVILTPTDDFVGTLRKTNQQILLVIVALTFAELLLIYFLARHLSRPIENVSQELKAVENLSFEVRQDRPSRVREIAQLQSAASLLRNSLLSFSAFAPLDLLRRLIGSNIPLALGVEPKTLTIMFTDLENFSTQAEHLTPADLLQQMSVYFEEVSRAIGQELGTVDKFIGDGIMAFWGAPAALLDHEMRACAGALRAARRMQTINENWQAERRPTFRLRVGLHTAEVLIGNIGSSERFSYTVMGDGVNVAARLEGVNKEYGTTICISDSVFDAVSSEMLVRPLRTIQVKGREQKFMAYELLGTKWGDDPELSARASDARLSELTWTASGYFERGDLTEAARRYKVILREFPSDQLASTMLAACLDDLVSSPTR